MPLYRLYELGRKERGRFLNSREFKCIGVCPNLGIPPMGEYKVINGKAKKHVLIMQIEYKD